MKKCAKNFLLTRKKLGAILGTNKSCDEDGREDTFAESWRLVRANSGFSQRSHIPSELEAPTIIV